MPNCTPETEIATASGSPLPRRNAAARLSYALINRSLIVLPSLAFAQLDGSFKRTRSNPLESSRLTSVSSPKGYAGVLLLRSDTTKSLSCSLDQSWNSSDSVKRLLRPPFLANIAAILSGYPARMTTILCCRGCVRQCARGQAKNKDHEKEKKR